MRLMEVHPRSNRSALRKVPLRDMSSKAKRFRDSERLHGRSSARDNHWRKGRDKALKGRRVSEHSNNQVKAKPRFPCNCRLLSRSAGVQRAFSPGAEAYPSPLRFSPNISHLSGFQVPPRSTLSEDRRQCRQEKALKLPGVLSTHQFWRRRPGRIPMVTLPSAGSNARAGARAPATPPYPPMGAGGTRWR